MKIRVVAIGADRSKLFEPAVDEYLERLGHYARTEIVELAASKQRDQSLAKLEDGRALIAKLRERELVIALDERGEEFSSEEFSKEILQSAMNRGRDLAFLIGGPEGHSEEVRRRADRVLALSRMTLPHRLARVVLLEQLYRACTIARGEPYHK